MNTFQISKTIMLRVWTILNCCIQRQKILQKFENDIYIQVQVVSCNSLKLSEAIKTHSKGITLNFKHH